MVAVEYFERRRSDRAGTSWPVEARLGGFAMTGVIRDVSADGAFVAFGAAAAPPGPETSSSLGNGLEIGDQLVLRFRPGAQGESVQAIGTLRWSGFSDEHGRYGYGFQFEPG